MSHKHYNNKIMINFNKIYSWVGGWVGGRKNWESRIQIESLGRRTCLPGLLCLANLRLTLDPRIRNFAPPNRRLNAIGAPFHRWNLIGEPSYLYGNSGNSHSPTSSSAGTRNFSVCFSRSARCRPVVVL